MVSPLSSSIMVDAVSRGQERTALEFGMASPSHFSGAGPVLTGVFGGYLYANVSLARVAAARIPGMSAEDIDREMFGLSDAPPIAAPARRSQPRARRDGSCAMRRVRSSARTRRPHRRSPRVPMWRRGGRRLPDIESADEATLLGLADGVRPWFERMMYHLLFVSATPA